MSIWHTQIIPDDLFSSSRLTSVAAIDAALAQFEALVNVHHQRTGILIADLLQTQQNAVPLVISCIRDDAFSLLRAHVSRLSQVDPKLFADSMALQLLTNLSHFLYFHDLPSISQSHDLIRNSYPIVQNAPIVLKSLSTAEYVEEVAIPEDEEDSFRNIRIRLTQKGKRHIRAKSKVLDPKPFKNLSIQVPSSQVEAQKLTLQLLQELENILDVRLITPLKVPLTFMKSSVLLGPSSEHRYKSCNQSKLRSM
ncbi:hypothetical protein DFH05DRAFT_446732 [Lentinula detonsa]|uniref:Uncharacterized protein n=1 Tax=Lentinula detonsa TaxID=2804962 RepID=A0A9W8TTX4_9AGAR|nr:hypothetical protein DFH05DRAFT_446732 [Lentinula detonsa]